MKFLKRLQRLNKKANKFDLPFHAKLGTEFLVFLSALMTVLCLLSVMTSLSLNRVAERWTGGLENSLTVEIPYSDKQSVLAHQVLSSLQDAEGIKSAKLMDKKEVGNLLTPWLGDLTVGLDKLPMPMLLTVETRKADPKLIARLKRMIEEISGDLRVDTHEKWLMDLLKFTSALKLLAFLIMLAIGLVTTLTVAGAVRSRMAIHQGELELLHIMGADDNYITKQFQRYILLLSGKGILIGLIISVMLAAAFQLMSMQGIESVPGIRLTLGQFMALPVTAGILLLVCGVAAKFTANKVLAEMP